MNAYGMSQITHTHRTNTAKNSNTCAKNSRTYVHNHASCNAGSSGPAGPQHECGLARLLHDTNSNNKQDKPHAHIAQTPRKTRRTGGITRAYTLKIKFSALRGTREQRGSEMRAKERTCGKIRRCDDTEFVTLGDRTVLPFTREEAFEAFVVRPALSKFRIRRPLINRADLGYHLC